MTKSLRYLLLLFIVIIASCSDEEGQYADVSATVTFWTKNTGSSLPNVTINGKNATITQSYTSAPLCDAYGCATFILAPGTYQYTATGDQSWSGYITVTASDECLTQELVVTPSAYGDGTFWTQTDLGCGNITVIINGVSRIISSYYASRPSCGSYGCANFNLPVGTYPFTASCNSYNWEGEIEITDGGCSTMRLYVGDKSSNNQTSFPPAKDECKSNN